MLSGDRRNRKASGAMKTISAAPMIQEVVCQPRFKTPTDISGIMIAPPARKAALLMDITSPR